MLNDVAQKIRGCRIDQNGLFRPRAPQGASRQLLILIIAKPFIEPGFHKVREYDVYDHKTSYPKPKCCR